MSLDQAKLRDDIKAGIKSKLVSLEVSVEMLTGYDADGNAQIDKTTTKKNTSDDLYTAIATAVAEKVIEHLKNNLEVVVTVPSGTFSQGAGTAATPNPSPVQLPKAKIS